MEPIRIDYKTTRILRAAVASDSDPRPTLQYAHLTPRFIEALNGHVAIRVALDREEDETWTAPEFLIHTSVLKQVKARHSLCVDPWAREVWIGKDPLCAKEDAVAVLPDALNTDALPFPNVDQVLPAWGCDGGRVLALGAKVLKAIAEIAGNLDTYDGRVTLEVPEHGHAGHVVTAVLLKATDGQGREVTGAAMPIVRIEK